VAFALAANGLLFAAIGIAADCSTSRCCMRCRARLRHRRQSHPAGDSLLRLHGADPRTLRHAEDLLDTIGQLFGSLRGGLAYAVILVGGLLAATTGVVAATVIAMA